ncbi:MAG: hypothetical protein UY58_C0008G0012 [Candidatus Magasanikbacteria bacterium GW2011_GWA2_50_22]|uniref:Uncharacterized protein n=1 Tax=Candidatus Magasanikbacteria bacterium GW2011_GWA2_50_22 TaxID=1619043 RepID=A0A0G1WEL8_9BACT|nr:MAG: hypothetical protein UY58_C0008G0012 [Candidatus Magasanikbacteria bacterium GW2011_GWA2_50_22]
MPLDITTRSSGPGARVARTPAAESDHYAASFKLKNVAKSPR